MNLEQISDSLNNKQSDKISLADGIDDVSEIAIDSLSIPNVETIEATSASILDSALDVVGDAVGAVLDGILSWVFTIVKKILRIEYQLMFDS